MTALDALFEKLWGDYAAMNTQAEVIHRALEARGEKIVNDHIAFRTFQTPLIGIDAIAAPFVKHGYRPAEDYTFEEKKLAARYYTPPDPLLPKVFISALKTHEFSEELQSVIRDLLAQVKSPSGEDFLISGTPWKKISWAQYQGLLRESEYAAWMAAFGFRVNHFTVFYNELKTFADFRELNTFIKGLGFALNQAGGEVKGSPSVYLEQSSTLAHPVEVEFADRREVIPACYYEFARRYPMPDGKLFQGFIPDSANRIFESTHFRK